jgi:hypothetical protein
MSKKDDTEQIELSKFRLIWAQKCVLENESKKIVVSIKLVESVHVKP